MDCRIGFILKLLRNECVSIFFFQLRRLLDRTPHSCASRCQHDLCAERLHDLAPLHAHRIRHRQDQMQSLSCRHESKSDSGVAACRFDDHRILIDLSFLNSLLDHCIRHTILDTSQRIKIFQLCYNLCAKRILLLIIG